MNLQPITALSPLDGRYESKVSALREHFSEFGLIRNRVKVEIEWLKALAAAPELAEIAPFSAATVAELDAVIADFSVADGEAVKAIEATTNHDVKAMEYWLKERLGHNPEVTRVTEFIHFGCTSEDINNVSHALMLRDGRDTVLLPALDKIIARRVELAHQHAELIALRVLANFHVAAPHDDGAFGDHHLATEHTGLACVVVAQVVGFDIHGLVLVGLFGVRRADR